MMKLRLMLASVFMAAVSSLCAESLSFTNVQTAAGWNVARNWVNGSGENPQTPPVDGEDVSFPALTKKPFVQNVYGTNLTSLTVGTMSSDADDRTFKMHIESVGDVKSARTFTVANPNGYKGRWDAGNDKVTLILPATSAVTSTMSKVSAEKNPTVQVPTAGTKAAITELYRDGAFHKTGSGELSVGSTPMGETRAFLDAGVLTLDPSVATSAVDVDALLATSSLHLDASRKETMTVSDVNGDGTSGVTRWNDVHGHATYAYYDSTKITHAPFLEPTATAPSGLPFVGFGSYGETSTTAYGPKGCGLLLSAALSGVREAFYVVESYNAAYTSGGTMKNRVVVCGPDKAFLNQDDDYLFYSGDSSDTRVWKGDLRLNGVKTRNGDASVTSMKGHYIYSVGTRDDCSVTTLGYSSTYTLHVGGFRLGEVILFEKVLTDAERSAVNRYLRSKWHTANAEADLSEVIAASGTKVGVAAGKTARVKRLTTAGNTLVKVGSGELIVNNLAAKCNKATIEGGVVTFGPGTASAGVTGSPATNAFLWLDAAVNVTHPSGASVSKWADCRAAYAATRYVTSANSSKAFTTTDFRVPGKTVIDMGLTSTSSQDYFSVYNAKNVYAGFCVFRMTTITSNSHPPVFGSSDWTWNCSYRNGYLFGGSTRWNSNLAAGHWTLDAVPYDPMVANARLHQSNDFVVVAFTAANPVPANRIAADNNSKCGNIQIGEYILYDRPVSDDERTRIEAYLMKKWLGKDHPEIVTARTLDEVTVSGSTAGLGAEIPVTVRRVNGTLSDGTFSKTGTNTLTISNFNVADVGTLAVRSGELKLATAAIDAEPAFHFDASDLSSMTYYVEDGVTSVTAWADTRANGLTTYVPISANPPGTKAGLGTYTNPTLKVVSTATGVKRPVLDFGELSQNSTVAQQKASSASLIMTEDGSTAKKFTTIREAVIVFKDRNTTGNGPALFDDGGNTFLRSGLKILDGTYASENLRNGYIGVDGEDFEYSTTLPSGFHVVYFGATAGVSIQMFARGKNGSGGCYIAEAIGYTNELTAVQRHRLERSLMTKWLGAAESPYVHEYDAVSVAAGSRLTLATNEIISANTLSGGGRISSSAVSGVSALSFNLADGTVVNPLVVDGTLGFGANVTLEVTSSSKVPCGDYELIRAGNLGDVDVATWTLQSSVRAQGAVRLVRVGNAIVLRVTNKGLVLIFR